MGLKRMGGPYLGKDPELPSAQVLEGWAGLPELMARVKPMTFA